VSERYAVRNILRQPQHTKVAPAPWTPTTTENDHWDVDTYDMEEPLGSVHLAAYLGHLWPRGMVDGLMHL
jgi:hypothetical protein